LMLRVFKPALRRAEIENFVWHDLRHTFASRLVMKGVSLLEAKELLGHKTIQMTLRYAHLAPGRLLEAVQKLSDTRTDTEASRERKDRADAIESSRSSRSAKPPFSGSNPLAASTFPSRRQGPNAFAHSAALTGGSNSGSFGGT